MSAPQTGRQTDLDDATLEEIRLALAPEIAANAGFDGWGDEAIEAAAKAHGVKPSVARLAFPDGPMDLIGAFIASVDERMIAEFSDKETGKSRLDNTPIRERIRQLVWFRLECTKGLEEAVRRALAIQAMPQNIATTLKSGWHSADLMWRLAGDTATDYNHYTKRMTLGTIYAASLASFVEDDSADKAEASAFLDRRIEGVMKFEKAKAQLLQKRETFDVARFLGRLRYGQR